MRERNEAVLTAVRQRLEDDPDSVLPTLRLLADPDGPVRAVDDSTLSLARTLNHHRIVARLRELRARSYSTAQVAELLGGISRQAVSARVAKGRLMSIQISGKAWFPDWQFASGRPLHRLDEAIAALQQTGHDTLSADALMTNPLPEEGGRTVADLLATGAAERALHYIWAAGGGF